MDGFERITGREHDGLVEKCQENGWLKVGGFDWQDDPFLEEYPYEFSRTESVDRLREALGSGNWAIRQGFCYRDLAFIQQVNGGDEWWTLKRDGDAWTGFESWSFGAIAQEPERFERAMRDMCEATPEQCRSGEWAHLHEKAPEPLAQRAASAREASRAHAGRKPAPQWRARGPSGPNRDDRGAKAPLFISTGREARMASDYGDEAGGKLLDWMRGSARRPAPRQWSAARGSSPSASRESAGPSPAGAPRPRGRRRADLREAQPRGALGASRVRDDPRRSSPTSCAPRRSSTTSSPAGAATGCSSRWRTPPRSTRPSDSSSKRRERPPSAQGRGSPR